MFLEKNNKYSTTPFKTVSPYTEIVNMCKCMLTASMEHKTTFGLWT